MSGVDEPRGVRTGIGTRWERAHGPALARLRIVPEHDRTILLANRGEANDRHGVGGADLTVARNGCDEFRGWISRQDPEGHPDRRLRRWCHGRRRGGRRPRSPAPMVTRTAREPSTRAPSKRRPRQPRTTGHSTWSVPSWALDAEQLAPSRTGSMLVTPPTMSTRPSGRSTAARWASAATIGPVGVQELVDATYRSALASVVPEPTPPAMSTEPSAMRAAACSCRTAPMVGPSDHVPRAGSKMTEFATGEGWSPPATSTRPSASNVAVCSLRTPGMAPVCAHVPDAGS